MAIKDNLVEDRKEYWKNVEEDAIKDINKTLRELQQADNFLTEKISIEVVYRTTANAKGEGRTGLFCRAKGKYATVENEIFICIYERSEWISKFIQIIADCLEFNSFQIGYRAKEIDIEKKDSEGGVSLIKGEVVLES